MQLVATHPRVTREYETVFILRPDALEEDKNKVHDRIRGVVDRLSGHILKSEEWGKRKLAYHIKKNSHGLYFYLRYLGYGDLVGELERNLRILEPVLKYMTIKLDEDVADPEKRKTEAQHETTRAPRDDAPEERTALREDDESDEGSLEEEE